MISLERAWAEIDLDNLRHNYQILKNLVEPGVVLSIIKADAYGHGAPQVAKTLADAGAKRFAVATAQEAMQLRRHGITQPILLLGATSGSWAAALAAKNVSLTVVDLHSAKEYAKSLGNKVVGIHIKIDTGMGRLGIDAKNTEDAAKMVLEIANMPCFRLDGMFTHFPAADEISANDYTCQQSKMFNRLVARLKECGLCVPILHSANSAATITHKHSWDDMVRPGLALYGSNPCKGKALDLKQVMSLRARISQVKRIEKGQFVSYGRIWQAKRDSVIAVVTIGYADGLFRNLSGKINMLVNGAKAPQIGRICMDMCMLDVTDIEGVEVDDAATIFGEDGMSFISADEVAKAAQTVPYEVYCAVGRRMPRFYSQDGCFIQEVAYIDEL